MARIPDEDLERLKAEVSLVSLVEARGGGAAQGGRGPGRAETTRR